MKNRNKLWPLPIFCLLLTGCGAGNQIKKWPTILIILAVMLLAFAGLRTYNFILYLRRQQRRKNNRRKVKRTLDSMTWAVYALAALLLFGGILGSCTGSKEPVVAEIPEEIVPEETESVAVFAPQSTNHTDPDEYNIRWEIFQDGQLQHSYIREDPIFFGASEDYTTLSGITTFRGDNYRSNTTYGTADVKNAILLENWTYETSALGSWGGSGWTGQPLIVRWDAQTKKHMNLYEDKKSKEDLVEVIYATLDGNIYFLDLDDGTATRDAICVGMCFKGSGSLDPRGYPLMYVGSGDKNMQDKQPRMFVISLIDGKILYEYGNDDPLSMRRDNENWCAFDSAPLVDAETDTLIWPGENGLLYTIKLNSKYNATDGTVSVSPDSPVLTRYHMSRNTEKNYWIGYEASASIAENYLYVSENGGMFYCVDLNTMELVWVQDTKDDSNCSPVFQWISEEEAYVYTAPSLHWTQNENAQGSVSFYKLDALTGEIVWQVPYDVYTVDGVSGGVQSTPLLGKKGTDLENIIFVTISRTPNIGGGILVALDTKTGNTLWSMDMQYYAWSSPVAVYEKDGTGYVVVCDSNGDAYLLDGTTGEVKSTLSLGGLVEATPVVFDDMLVVGTRKQKIFGIQIS